MSAVSFDTFRFVKTLEAGGFERAQVEGIARAFRDASSGWQLVTKQDMEIEFAPVKAELLILNWMNSLVLGGIIVLILKSFF